LTAPPGCQPAVPQLPQLPQLSRPAVAPGHQPAPPPGHQPAVLPGRQSAVPQLPQPPQLPPAPSPGSLITRFFQSPLLKEPRDHGSPAARL